MNPFTQKFNTTAKQIRLTDAERSRIHAALTASMQAPTPSPFLPLFFYRAGVAAFLCILVVGGTAFAAEGALPGDALYSVKVGAIEPVFGAFAFSDEAKAAWNAGVATERLDEAQALAMDGKLDASTSDALAVSFAEHASGVADAAAQISERDPSAGSAVSTQFSTAVSERGAAILAAGKRSSNSLAVRASGDLVLRVAGGGDTPADASGTAFEAASVAAPMAKVSTMMALAPQAATEASTDDAELLSLRAHELLAQATSTIAARDFSASMEADLNARVAAIKNHIVQADAELSIGSTSEAAADFTGAIENIVELRNSLDTDFNRHYDGDVPLPTSVLQNQL